MADPNSSRAPSGATGVLVLASGEVVWGRGFGAEGQAVGEVCFNTAMTGYQEVMTDPSYAGQIINFTFPHIGNVGTNLEDVEALNPHALGAIVRQDVTDPSNFRSTQHFDAWMKSNGRIGISGVDTRALTRLIRVAGAPNAVIAHNAKGEFDVPAMLARAKAWAGLEGMDLAKDVTTLQTYKWDQGLWTLGGGYARDGARAHGVSTGLDTNGDDGPIFAKYNSEAGAFNTNRGESDAPSHPFVSSPVETPIGRKPTISTKPTHQ
jgi:carbamoyl-phosphate synthase small subunit